MKLTPRTQEKIQHAIGFAKIFLKNDASLSRSLIDKHLGRVDTKIGKFLRTNILKEQKNGWYSMDRGITKSYSLNEKGLQKLKAMVQVTVEKEREIAIKIAPSIYDELLTLNFSYIDKSGRLWNQIQNLPRDIKKYILAQAGLPHQYDINSAAFSLLTQHARLHCGADQYFYEIEENYLKHKTAYRNKIASDAELTPKQAKILLTALLCGARLSSNKKHSSIMKMINDKSIIEYLKQDQSVVDLKQDIKDLWNWIEPSLGRRTIKTKAGHIRKLPLSPKQKWGRYFDLERLVLNATRRYLDSKGIKYFLEHDGWSTSEELNQEELIQFIEDSTGFNVSLDYELVNPNDIQSDTDHSAALANASPCIAPSLASAAHEQYNLSSDSVDDNNNHNHKQQAICLHYIVPQIFEPSKIKRPNEEDHNSRNQTLTRSIAKDTEQQVPNMRSPLQARRSSFGS